MSAPVTGSDRLRRWRLVLGVDADGVDVALDEADARIDRALTALYGAGGPDDGGGEGEARGGGQGRGGGGMSRPRVARWLGDIRDHFPRSVVHILQKDALERLGLEDMLLEPELLSIVEADVHLVATLCGLMSAMPERTRDTARTVVASVVDRLLDELRQGTVEALRGALDRRRRTGRPRPADIDWSRTIGANLHHYRLATGTIVPERLIGHTRRTRRAGDAEEVILCVDQSGSMAASVVYASIFGAVMASLPGLSTSFVAFDTSVLDLTQMLQDPVDVLFGVQLGGGTDIAQAIAYCEGLVRRPERTHLVLISDLYEGGSADSLLARLAALEADGVNVIVLTSLSDDGRSVYDVDLGRRIAGLGCAVFACTPDEFPRLMGRALRREPLDRGET